jgi:uncharacterized membrane protein
MVAILMKLGIDFKQPSTLRGLVWLVGSLVGLGFLIAGDRESASVAVAMTGTIAGGLGLGVND